MEWRVGTKKGGTDGVIFGDTLLRTASLTSWDVSQKTYLLERQRPSVLGLQRSLPSYLLFIL